MPLLFVILSSVSVSLWGQSRPTSDQLRAEELVNSCRQMQRPDEICRVLVTARDISADTVEAVKQFMDLTPNEYAALTVINAVATSRVRVRSRFPHAKQTHYILDFRRDNTTVTLEYSF